MGSADRKAAIMPHTTNKIKFTFKKKFLYWGDYVLNERDDEISDQLQAVRIKNKFQLLVFFFFKRTQYFRASL